MDAERLAILKELDRNRGIDPLPPDWYYFPFEELMSSTDMICAEYHSGFSFDLTSWKLWISSTGRLSQIVEVCRGDENFEKRYEFHLVEIGENKVQHLLDLAEEVGFARYSEKYESFSTDLCREWIGVRLRGKLKIVEVYDFPLEGFEKLWQQIINFAPVV